jgi:hypothetical protein
MDISPLKGIRSGSGTGRPRHRKGAHLRALEHAPRCCSARRRDTDGLAESASGCMWGRGASHRPPHRLEAHRRLRPPPPLRTHAWPLASSLLLSPSPSPSPSPSTPAQLPRGCGGQRLVVCAGSGIGWTNWLLAACCCLLCIVYCLLAVGCWLLAVVYCILPVACLLAIVYYLLSIVYWLL